MWMWIAHFECEEICTLSAKASREHVIAKPDTVCVCVCEICILQVFHLSHSAFHLSLVRSHVLWISSTFLIGLQINLYSKGKEYIYMNWTASILSSSGTRIYFYKQSGTWHLLDIHCFFIFCMEWNDVVACANYNGQCLKTPWWTFHFVLSMSCINLFLWILNSSYTSLSKRKDVHVVHVWRWIQKCFVFA